MWSQICGKTSMFVHKVTLKKKEKKKKHIKLKNFKAYFFLKQFLDVLGHFSPNLRPHFLKQFSLNYLFVFYSKLNTV